jgi:hypothetical protein
MGASSILLLEAWNWKPENRERQINKMGNGMAKWPNK